MKGFTTKAIHTPSVKSDVHGALRTPVYENVSFESGTSHDLQLAFEGKKPAHTYSRITNPTVEDFEQRIRLLSDAQGVIAVSSGMAAIADTVMALADAGSNLITTRHLFGNTVSLFEKTLGRWGLQVRYVDMNDPAAVGNAIDERTGLVYLESISNPQLEVADVAAICAAVDGRVPVVLDGTLTTPYLFRSKDAGVSVEVISATKYISGGATCVGGLIIDNGTFDWRKHPLLSQDAQRVGPCAFLMRLRREVYRNLGSCMSPHNAWLHSLGLETMGLRVDRSCQNALALARFLTTIGRVTSVNYPGLETSPFHAIALRQFGGRFNGILTFDLGSRGECFKFMDSLRLIRRSTNLNDNKSLIIHPASTIFCEFSPQERAALNVTENTLRLSAGIEDVEDLIDDIQQGLGAL